MPDYQNAAWMAQSKAAVIRAVAKGVNPIWCISSNPANNPAYEITAANWNDYRLAVLDAAAWAQANGVFEFQIGNEEEMHNDDTTLTDAQLLINLKSLATEVQAIFTRGNVSYSVGASTTFINNWIVAGRGDLDLIELNIYRGGSAPFNNDWKTHISNMVDAFGADHTSITEFSLSYTSLDSYSTDEEEQATALLEMINYIKGLKIKKASFFNYGPLDTFGARKADGTYRKIWELLKIQNDWKRRKTSSQSGLGGLSHG